MKTKGMEQPQLVEGLRKLEDEAIDELVHQYSRPLFGVILNYTKNPQDAEEILQDTLVKIVRKIETFRDQGDIWPWIKRIAINNSIIWLRKNRATREHELRMDDHLPQFSADGQHSHPVFDWGVDPEQLLLNKEVGGLIYDAVQVLPFEYRAPLVLREIEGYSIREISALLGIKEAATKTRIHRARLFVRERLAKHFSGRHFGGLL
ncbi:MAG: RNA polymerase sigma factor [Acidobacteria bacterium]|nr:RNA polymerase sigma factor [Acidobacteriota bacterium]